MRMKMHDDWRSAVEENRETLERWADADLPLSEDIGQLLDRADRSETDDRVAVRV